MDDGGIVFHPLRQGEVQGGEGADDPFNCLEWFDDVDDGSDENNGGPACVDDADDAELRMCNFRCGMIVVVGWEVE